MLFMWQSSTAVWVSTNVISALQKSLIVCFKTRVGIGSDVSIKKTIRTMPYLYLRCTYHITSCIRSKVRSDSNTCTRNFNSPCSICVKISSIVATLRDCVQELYQSTGRMDSFLVHVFNNDKPVEPSRKAINSVK